MIRSLSCHINDCLLIISVRLHNMQPRARPFSRWVTLTLHSSQKFCFTPTQRCGFTISLDNKLWETVSLQDTELLLSASVNFGSWWKLVRAQKRCYSLSNTSDPKCPKQARGAFCQRAAWQIQIPSVGWEVAESRRREKIQCEELLLDFRQETVTSCITSCSHPQNWRGEKRGWCNPEAEGKITKKGAYYLCLCIITSSITLNFRKLHVCAEQTDIKQVWTEKQKSPPRVSQSGAKYEISRKWRVDGCQELRLVVHAARSTQTKTMWIIDSTAAWCSHIQLMEDGKHQVWILSGLM